MRLEHSESNRSNFKTNSVANRKPMQIRKYGRDVAEPRLLVRQLEQEYSGHAEGESDLKRMCSQERVAEIESGANYCCSYGFRCQYTLDTSPVYFSLYVV